MPFTFHIGNHSCQISEKYLRDIIDNKKEHVFSTYEKFIDFFRNIFTRRSLISDYKEIYNLLCQKNERPDITKPFSLRPFSRRDEDCTRWRPLLGYIKLIDASRPETMDKYTVEVLAHQENMLLLQMFYDGVLVTETECSEHCVDFLKETMFNYNSGEITLAALDNDHLTPSEAGSNGIYEAFEQRLIDFLTTPATASGDESGAIDQTDASQPAAIEAFINSPEFQKNIRMRDIEKNKIGSGSYGTVYLLNDEFVVKIPINERGIKVDVNSPEHRNCHPDRVSKYLNMANDDKNFSRSASMNINGKDVTVLVSKYIQGQELDVEDEDNYRMAEELLKSRGVFMHDINILGNILVKGGVLFFVDGDQMVLSQESRQQRSVSLATRQLEEQIKAHHLIKLKRAETEENTEDIEYYKSLIADLDALIGEEEQTPAPGRRFKLAAPEEGTLVAKVLKNELKK
ncbi:Secreted effector kinase SteC [Salmonella enterica subsp. enterica serovar Mokola]|uniref:SPI-2 type III secretion system effector kinase SteC n=1 Tax=Salmonella enterica TaxID=28901 RepID=UPI00107C4767|nr:Secreted effector kinase SteC [Salmonella enterica subsp. enterica]EBB9192833.1 Secreted effector kinase SteC [Salmonella enterica]ECD8385148.1 Secreted effector kinase SteC [Salmonella enterica subsp. enterica serovar Stockholm]ECG2649423.1 Secreted effector kinase SteC [Salmonella enterica subsp. enterica serovar Chailey]EHK8183666.1 Secreted effector kinase SteC [Salmonella enterica subsp. enterica serovar Enteritidis]EIM5301556.1 Secreted effector kinase SteC [Salmonella enterica subsp.